MRAGALFIFVVAASLGHAQPSSSNVKSPKPSVELRVQDSHVGMGDDLLLATVFRSREGRVTLWNSFGWNSASGLQLQVLDPNGRKVKSYNDLYDILPPSESGAGDLVSIGGNNFVGFESWVPVKFLFPKPGQFLLKCTYTPPLPRLYFPGITIWETRMAGSNRSRSRFSLKLIEATRRPKLKSIPA